MKWYKYDIRDLSEAEYGKWFLLMNGEKQKKVSRFRYEDDKKRSVAGEMLARKAVSDWCAVSAEDIVFGNSGNGKPFAENLNVEFNISHSGDIVVCAVDDKPVGIDIEQIRPIDLNVAKRICTKNEILYLFGYEPCEKDFNEKPDDEMLTRFFEIWTAKEAYLKKTGVGIVADLKSLSTDSEKIYREYYENYIITVCT